MSNKIEKNGQQLTTKLPNLHEKQPEPIGLVAEYWTPISEGETKRVFVAGVRNDIYEDEVRGSIELPCAIMLEQQSDGSIKAVKNGAKRLVAAIENAINAGDIVTIGQYQEDENLTPTGLEIVFTGKQKNKNNGYMSDRFEIRRLL